MSAPVTRGISIAYLLVALVAALAGLSIYQWSSAPQPATSSQGPQDLLGAPRPAFSLPDLDGWPVSINRWDGKVILLNFWATWCPPCREEMPDFAQTQKEYRARGFQVIGVALDRPRPVAEFIKEVGAGYPQLIGRENAMAVADRYGNAYGGLPHSVLIDRDGIIRFIKAGRLSRRELIDELLQLL
ncbi:MAG: TlpA family protein disulfide reductase [Gammaproteobacteria bacterium]|nr:TlpA family protein disulfide reductase [Gammaproteobacteria bacterium]MBA3732017.1 TlpA family protein disulfide reductase [Gammaproteobacteria bacterium]